MDNYTINIARDFSRYPAGRYMKHGSATGQGFRVNHLVPALKKNIYVIVEMDGIISCGSSFLEEAFGGLVREENFTESYLKEHLKIIGTRKSLIDLIFFHIEKAQQIKSIEE